jgi:hypothetical protein
MEQTTESRNGTAPKLYHTRGKNGKKVINLDDVLLSAQLAFLEGLHWYEVRTRVASDLGITPDLASRLLDQRADALPDWPDGHTRWEYGQAMGREKAEKMRGKRREPRAKPLRQKAPEPPEPPLASPATLQLVSHIQPTTCSVARLLTLLYRMAPEAVIDIPCALTVTTTIDE